MISARSALDRLREGNARFVEGKQVGSDRARQPHTSQLSGGQNPFAVILGCSDSRVPAEIVFDQGLGDLFVIRVAGNIIAPSLIGSAEFAAAQFGTRLVVVLGHSNCGAVQATIDELSRPSSERSPNLQAIVNRIKPSVETLMEGQLTPEELISSAVRANIRASVNHLRYGSQILETLADTDGLMVVGAEYDLTTGRVAFLE